MLLVAFLPLHIDTRVDRGQEKCGINVLLKCNSLHLRNDFFTDVTQAKQVGQN